MLTFAHPNWLLVTADGASALRGRAPEAHARDHQHIRHSLVPGNAQSERKPQMHGEGTGAASGQAPHSSYPGLCCLSAGKFTTRWSAQRRHADDGQAACIDGKRSATRADGTLELRLPQPSHHSGGHRLAFLCSCVCCLVHPGWAAIEGFPRGRAVVIQRHRA